MVSTTRGRPGVSGFLLIVSCAVCLAPLSCVAEDPLLCHGIDGNEQACEDYTYAGSLVEDLAPGDQLREALAVQAALKEVPGPDAGFEQCEQGIKSWLYVVLEYYRTGSYSPEAIIPTQNYIMGNHDRIVQTCPAAWLVTLVLKIESNLERGRKGLTCARVHAAGCLRDARGYWKAMYSETRVQLAGHGAGPKEIQDLLVQGEMRIAASFKKSIMGGEEEL